MHYMLCAFLILTLSACNKNAVVNDLTADYTITLNDELITAYNNGDSILLYSTNKASSHEESYSDWKNYLDQFREDANGAFIIKQVPSNVLVSNNNDVDDYFSVFLKKEMPSYVEQGLIVESQVYTAIYNVYKGNDLTDEDKAFIIDEANLKINAE